VGQENHKKLTNHSRRRLVLTTRLLTV